MVSTAWCLRDTNCLRFRTQCHLLALLTVCFVSICTPWDWFSGFVQSEIAVIFFLWCATLILVASVTAACLVKAKGSGCETLLAYAAMQITLTANQTILWSFRVALDDIALGSPECERRHKVAECLISSFGIFCTMSYLILGRLLVARANVLGRPLGWKKARTASKMIWKGMACVTAIGVVTCCLRPFTVPGSWSDLVIFDMMAIEFMFFLLAQLSLYLHVLPLFLHSYRSLMAASVLPSAGNEGTFQQACADFLPMARNQFVALLLNVLTGIGQVVGGYFALRHTGSAQVLCSVCLIADSMTNTALVAILTGVHHHDSEKERAARRSEHRRKQKHKQSCKAYLPCEDQEWQAVVESLASRGFTLKSLLDFYASLKDAMPHFDPNIHRTLDVVRQAIIPASADESCAFASKMMNGMPVVPQRMVTHNWSNLFRDLVAAIVADAMHQPTYSKVADLLDNNVSVLMMMLDEGSLSTTYWVCAFSVNQHQAICATNPAKSVDSKTGLEHPVCQCGKKKFWNDTTPLRHDLKSIHCEMNKFDEMIAFLSASDENFTQIIAVDRSFEIFGRAWCVAEMAEANHMGMRQDIKLASRQDSGFDAQTSQLKQLDVRRMQASRPEDVTEILAKIKDVDEFNSHLQHLLLGDEGLFVVWNKFDIVSQTAELGRVTLFADIYARAKPGGNWDVV
eukprot:TRINITY_DN22520_c1_g1_i1.p1 TRINITY_DN22520_c1_g1~~TRINITY_DN22520_c1_g1_i1.p1  ORF type:complete len:683 (-),score=96.11 TRINITY_DN22520_c1_g1_i1:76-2124(-)